MSPIPNREPQADAHRRFRRSVLAAATVLFVAFSAGTALELVDEYRTIETNAHREARTLASSLAEVTARSIQTADIVLELLSVRRGNGAGPDSTTDGLETFRDRIPLVKDLALADARGSISDSTFAEPPADVTGTPAFVAARDGPAPGLIIGAPAAGPPAEAMAVPLVRRISTPDGGFQGAAMTWIGPEALDDLHDELELGPETILLLAHADGTVIARAPSSLLVGRSAADRPLFAEHLSQAAEGSYLSPEQRDGQTRITGFSRTEPYPFVVAAALSRDAQFSGWRASLVADAAFVLFVGAMLFGAAVLLLRQSARLREHVTSVERTRLTLSANQARLAETLRRQEAIARLSQTAITTSDLDGFLSAATQTVATTLGADCAAVLHLTPDGTRLSVMAGHGCSPEALGRTTLDADGGTLSAYTLTVDDAVITTDFEAEDRFEASPLVRDHGIRSAVTAPVRLSDGPYGVIGAFSRRTGTFTEDGAVFLRAVAYVVASTLDRQREARLRETVLNSVTAHIAVLDESGRIVMVNDGWRDFAGDRALHGAGFPVGANYLDLCHDVDGPGNDEIIPVVHGLRSVLEGRRGEFSLEYSRHGAEGRRWFRVTVTPLTFDSHRGAVVMHVDVTARRLTEEQLRESQRMEAVGQLTGGVAHDFNNLLTVILGNVELLADAPALGEDERTLAELIQRAAERAAELTNRLLAFSRRQTLHPSTVDVSAVVVELRRLFQRTLPEHITVATELAKESCLALLDQGQLQTALLNLCINAREAMPDGGNLTLRTRLVPIGTAHPLSRVLGAGVYVEVSVEDDGCGMTEEVTARAFEPFFTTREVGQGTGLGLSMVWGFVKQSGGHAIIDSRLGIGTAIRLYLPHHDRDGPPVEDEDTVPLRLFVEGRTALLVEDDLMVRDHLATMLTQMGFTVRTAASGREALDGLSTMEPVDVLITDVVMPGGVSGHVLATAARMRFPDLPILLITGYDGTTGPGGALPRFPVLTKPFHRSDIERTLARILSEPPRD